MSKRIPSPARSQSAVLTPSRHKHRKTRSVGSPARSTASVKLSSIVDSFHVSPMPTRRSVLNDDTDIEEPRRRSWWKKLSDNSRDVMEVLNDNKILDTNEANEFIDIEMLSQEKKNCTMDIPESSDNESISSIVIPQRKLFTQKENQPQKKFGQIIETRESLAKLQKTSSNDKTLHVAPKTLFNHLSKPKSKPIFSSSLLSISSNKTTNKTKEIAVAETKVQVRTLFGNRAGTKRKNMFADFIVSESEEDVSDIQPRVFGFHNNAKQQKETLNAFRREQSPTSSIATDNEMDEWKLLPSSTMVENQLEDMVSIAKTPIKRARLTKSITKAGLEDEQSRQYENERSQTEYCEMHNETGEKRRKLNENCNINNQEILKEITVENQEKHEESVVNKQEKRNASNIDNLEPHAQRHMHNQDINKENQVSHEQSGLYHRNDNNGIDNEQNILVNHEFRNKSDINNEKKDNAINIDKHEQHDVNNLESDKVDQIRHDQSDLDDQDNNDRVYNEKRSEQDTQIQRYEHERNQTKHNEMHSEIAKTNQGMHDKSTRAEDNQEKCKENTVDKQDKHNASYRNNLKQKEERHICNQESNKENQVIHDQGNSYYQDNNNGVNSADSIQVDHEVHKESDINNEEKQKQSDLDQQKKDGEGHEYKRYSLDNQYVHGKCIEINHKLDRESDGNHIVIDRENKIAHYESIVTKRDEQHIQVYEESKKSQLTQEENDEDIREAPEVSDEENQGAHEESDENNREAQEESDKETREVQEESDEENQEAQKESDEENEKANEVSYEENREVEEESVGENREANEVNNEENLGAGEESDEEIREAEEESDEENREAQGESDEEIREAEGESDEENREAQGESDEDSRKSNEVSYEENRVAEEESDEENREANEVSYDDNRVAEEESDEDNREALEESEEELQEEQSENEEEEVEDQTPEMQEDELEDNQLQEESLQINAVNSSTEIRDTTEDNEQNDDSNSQEIGNANKYTPNASHDTTGRHRKKEGSKVNSPEAILHNQTKQMESFMAKGRNTSLRRTSIMKSMNLRTSLAPPRESTGFSDGTKNSSAEGSGWDSHRTTRKTLRQTFGKDFSPRKSLRALVMEKSAKRLTADITSKFPQGNSTELPETTTIHDGHAQTTDFNHDVSKQTRQTTLEMYLQKIKKENMERKVKMEEDIRNSLKAPPRDTSNPFKLPSQTMLPLKKHSKNQMPKSKSKQTKTNGIQFDKLPAEMIEDMKYKPPKRFRPSNAAWITKRLYKHFETKLEPKYDYKARLRAEKLVETVYHFAKHLRRHDVAPSDTVDELKYEMARLEVVKTHFEFYQFFHDFMPREIRVKVVPDVVNKIPLPRHGIFSDILRGNTVQG